MRIPFSIFSRLSVAYRRRERILINGRYDEGEGKRGSKLIRLSRGRIASSYHERLEDGSLSTDAIVLVGPNARPMTLDGSTVLHLVRYFQTKIRSVKGVTAA